MAVRIETERDPERLRQIALLLEKENRHLHRRLAELTAKLAAATGADAIAQLQLELKLLHEQLAKKNQALFGRSSEKRPKGEAGDAPEKGAASTERRGHGPREQKALPQVEQIHLLDEPDRVCPGCGGELREMKGQYEESEEIDVIQREFRVVRHKRQKYVCRCGECVETAPGPAKLIPGGRYSVDFAIAVAVAKYLDHAPLARQERQMRREGLVVDRQTLWDQIFALHRHLVPTWEALLADVLAAPVILADETRWPLLGSAEATKWHAWGIASEEAIAYRILSSRSVSAAKEVLGAFQGTALVDGYGAYGALQSSRAGPTFVLAYCWSHVRRKYVDAEPHHPKATEMIEKIGALYEIERRASEAPAEERIAVRAELRRVESKPIIDDIYRWVTSEQALPRSLLGKALAYTRQLWPGLVRFVDDGRIPLDTNQLERGMRALALGRKNHFGSRSERGTQVAAIFYSLFETAKLVGVDPAAYLAEATRRAIANPGAVTLPRHLVSP